MLMDQKIPAIDALEKRSYAEICGVNADHYDDIKIDELNLTIRARNVLRHIKVDTIGGLMRFSPSELIRVRNLGAKTLKEMEQIIWQHGTMNRGDFCSTSTTEKKEIMRSSDVSRVVEAARENPNSLAEGDFSCFEVLAPLSDMEQKMVERYQEAFEMLGPDLILPMICEEPAVHGVIAALNQFVQECTAETACREQLKEAYLKIPAERRKQRAQYYIAAYTSDPEKLAILKKYCFRENLTISDYYYSLRSISGAERARIDKFFNWLTFDLDGDIANLCSHIFEKPHYSTVIKMRANKATLQMVGEEIGVTRERVRQIEGKMLREFHRRNSRARILQKICAVRNGDPILTPEELEPYFKENADVITYMLADSDHPKGYIYDSQSDTFIVGDNDSRLRLNQALVSLPDFFHDSSVASLIQAASEKYSVPEELLGRAIESEYRHTGITYHRSRLTRQQVYTSIIETYYPDGIKVYDHAELDQFRQLVLDNFGFDDLPENDRAISARIASFCIVCGRGTYKPRKDNYLPEELLERIYRFIKDHPGGAIASNAVFVHFKDELLPFGVDNRYFLHSILHEKYRTYFSFRRDYIVKDDSFTSFYQEIIDYIQRSPVPVSKEELIQTFKVSDITITIAASNENIINYFGDYLHGDNLNILPKEKNQLYRYLFNLTSDDDAHHVQDIYSDLEYDMSSFLGRNGITFPFRLFSVLEYLFSDEFQFSRPYVAAFGVKIDRPAEVLREQILDSDEIEIEEISATAKESRFYIYSLLEYLDSFNETHLFKDRDTLISINSCGITEDMIREIESQIFNEIDGKTMVIANLECVHHFPKINVPWTEWLIYSALKKWSRRLEVATTNAQLRHAAPIVAPRGEVNFSAVVSANAAADRIIQVDNLDNLDDLISDYIFDDNI